MSKTYGNDSQIAEIVKYISDNIKIPVLGAGGGFAPIGTISFFDGQTAPNGWILCDGSTYNISDYPELATYFASNHGSSNYYGGDGVTTFAVPVKEGVPNNADNVYDGEERIVGVWKETVDGVKKQKPLYEKRIDVDSPQSATNYPIGASDIDYVFITEATIISPTNEVIQFSTGKNPTGTLAVDRVCVNGTDYIYFNFSGNAIGSFTKAICVVRYTKTTDEWTLPTLGHSADGNGIFCVKATLSDAEINAFNVYTPREHQVAWWEEEIDGVWKRKPVYERTITSTTPSANGVIPNTSISDVDNPISMRVTILDSNNTYEMIEGSYSTYVAIYFSKVSGANVLYDNNAGFAQSRPAWVTIKYTKTTDDWQTS